MSSRLVGARALAAILLAAAGFLDPSSASASGFATTEVRLDFRLDPSGHGLRAGLAASDSVVGAAQLVLELHLVTPGMPIGEDLLLELRVLCSSEGGEVELLSSLDLFPAEAGSGRRRVLFDLSSLLALESLPCGDESRALRLLPAAEGQELVLDEEAPHAKLQIVRF